MLILGWLTTTLRYVTLWRRLRGFARQLQQQHRLQSTTRACLKWLLVTNLAKLSPTQCQLDPVPTWHVKRSSSALLLSVLLYAIRCSSNSLFRVAAINQSSNHWWRNPLLNWTIWAYTDPSATLACYQGCREDSWRHDIGSGKQKSRRPTADIPICLSYWSFNGDRRCPAVMTTRV